MPVDTCPTVITKWILEGFPKVAHVDDVRQCLDQNGFDEVEILEKIQKYSLNLVLVVKKKPYQK